MERRRSAGSVSRNHASRALAALKVGAPKLSALQAEARKGAKGTETDYRRLLDVCEAEAGTPNDTRKTFATRCADLVPIYVLSELLGRTNIQTTASYYTKTTEAHLKALHRRLG